MNQGQEWLTLAPMDDLKLKSLACAKINVATYCRGGRRIGVLRTTGGRTGRTRQQYHCGRNNNRYVTHTGSSMPQQLDTNSDVAKDSVLNLTEFHNS